MHRDGQLAQLSVTFSWHQCGGIHSCGQTGFALNRSTQEFVVPISIFKLACWTTTIQFLVLHALSVTAWPTTPQRNLHLPHVQILAAYNGNVFSWTRNVFGDTRASRFVEVLKYNDKATRIQTVLASTRNNAQCQFTSEFTKYKLFSFNTQ